MATARTLLAVGAGLLLTVTGANVRGADTRFLRFGAEADAPVGYLEMCGRDPGLCAVPANGPADGPVAPALRDQVRLRLLRQVTDEVNGAVVPRSDAAAYGVDEYWSRPGLNGGDCEDVAIAKRLALVRAGFPAGRLFFAVVFRRDRGLHTVLVARLDGGDYLLDSLTSRVDRWSRGGYRWLRLQSPADPRTWSRSLAT